MTHSTASLYRGIAAPIMVEAPKRATKFAANEQYTTLYKRLFGFEKVTQSLSVMTGVSAGITEAFLIVPFELVKVRMQDKANVSKKKKNARVYVIKKNVFYLHKIVVYNSLVSTLVLLMLSRRLLPLKVQWLYSMVWKLPCGVMVFGTVLTLV